MAEQHPADDEDNGHAKECPICLQSFVSVCTPNDRPYITNCQHTFCGSCIARHLKNKRECPLCRQTIKLVRLEQHSGSIQHKDQLFVLKIKYGKQLFEMEVERDVSYKKLKAQISAFFDLSHQQLKLVHKGKVLDQHNFASSGVVVQDGNGGCSTIQVIGSQSAGLPWKPPPPPAPSARSLPDCFFPSSCLVA